MNQEEMVAFSKVLLISVPAVVAVGIALLWWKRNGENRSYAKIGYVSGLFVHPVKSCKRLPVDSTKCFKEGMEFDRRWVVLDENDTFISLRQESTLALVKPHFEQNQYLCLDAPGMDTLKVKLQSDTLESKRIRIFRNFGEGTFVGNEASEWFSKYLKRPGCKMYKLSKPRVIAEDSKWGDKALPDDRVSFGDFAPYMVASEASLKAVNEELSTPVTMERFRPNVVVSGTGPFEEDTWKGRILKIGDLELRFLKECDRCLLTTVNPEIGKRDGDEPLATLRKIRLPEDRDPRFGNSPFFGVMMAPVGKRTRVIKLGDPVMISL